MLVCALAPSTRQEAACLVGGVKLPKLHVRHVKDVDYQELRNHIVTKWTELLRIIHQVSMLLYNPSSS